MRTIGLGGNARSWLYPCCLLWLSSCFFASYDDWVCLVIVSLYTSHVSKSEVSDLYNFYESEGREKEIPDLTTLFKINTFVNCIVISVEQVCLLRRIPWYCRRRTAATSNSLFVPLFWIIHWAGRSSRRMLSYKLKSSLWATMVISWTRVSLPRRDSWSLKRKSVWNTVLCDCLEKLQPGQLVMVTVKSSTERTITCVKTITTTLMKSISSTPLLM